MKALVKSRAVAATIRTDTVAATGAVIRAVEEYQLVFTSGGIRSIAPAVHATVSNNGSD